MAERVEQGDLVAVYGRLLPPRQRQWMQLYYGWDWSLAEVAAAAGVSRQAVQAALVAARRRLLATERAVGAVAGRRRRRQAGLALQAAAERLVPRTPGEEEAWRELVAVATRLATTGDV